MSRGFTLIELLVATALAVTLIGLVAGSLLHTSRTAAVVGEVLAMHDAAAGVNRVLAERLQAQEPATSWHLTADAGADGAWGTGDERCTLTFMAASADRNDRLGGFTAPDIVALNWYRLSWQGPDASGAGSSLTWAVSSRERSSREWPVSGYATRHWSDPASTDAKFGYKVAIQPQPRRDRRRDLDDNDLRYIEGMSPARYGALDEDGGPLHGDALDLTADASALVHASTTVEDLMIGWIDRAGWETRFDPALGLVRRDAAGAAAAFPASPAVAWLCRTRVSLDGVFTDGRAHAADARDVGDARPVVLRLAFTLRRPPPPSVRSRDPIVQRFAFAVPLQPGLPRPASSWPRGVP